MIIRVFLTIFLINICLDIEKSTLLANPLEIQAPISIPQISNIDNTEIYLISVGLGKSLHARYGHTFLKIVSGDDHQKYIYNWGAFSFEDPLFPLKFFLGERNYWVEFAQKDLLIARYKHYEDRNVWQRKINLTSNQKRRLIDRTNDQISTENMVFRYEHFYQNCSTKVRDIIDYALLGYVSERLNNSSLTVDYRYYVVNHMAIIPPLGFVLDITMNSLLDQRLNYWQESFYPVKLDQYLSELYAIDDQGKELDIKLLGDKLTLVQASSSYVTYQKKFGLWWLIFWSVFLVYLMMVFLFDKSSFENKLNRYLYRLISISWGIVSGVFGILMVIAWVFSTHYDMHHNLNILLLFCGDIYYVFFGKTKTLSKSSGLRFLKSINFDFKMIYILIRTMMIIGYLIIVMAGISDQNVKTAINYILPIQLSFLLISAQFLLLKNSYNKKLI